MKKLVLTGCLGFIGHAVAQSYLQQGWQVLGIDNYSGPGSRAAQARHAAELSRFPHFHLLEADLCQAEALQDLPFSQADLMIHLAAWSGVRASERDPEHYLQNNLGSTLGALQLCQGLQINQFILSSSSTVYWQGKAFRPFQEGHSPMGPRSPYGHSKWACEQILRRWNQAGFSFVILRLFSVYGPGQRQDLVLPRIVSAIEQGKPFRIFGQGQQLRDFTYVDDIVRAIQATERLLQTGKTIRKTFNIGSSRPVSLHELIQVVSKGMERSPELIYAPPKRVENEFTWADIQKAQQILDFRPQISLEVGVQRYLAWWNMQRDAE